MPGSNAGTGQPLILKCSKCKLSRELVHIPGDNVYLRAGVGELVRTGRTRKNAGRAGARMTSTAYECECLVCGHVGWYRHVGASRRPLKGAAPPASDPPHLVHYESAYGEDQRLSFSIRVF